MPEEFQKFTDRALRVLTLAREEAQRFNHNYIGTEHLLLGLVREEGGVAARVLRNMGVDLVKARTAVEFIIGRGDSMIVDEMRLTPRAKRVIELADREAQKLHHHFIGTEHLLLGILTEGQGIAAGVLASLGVPLAEVRQQILSVIGQTYVPEDSETPDKFQKFTERAREVLRYAQEEAQRLNHTYIGPEHLLLGLVREGDGVAARVLSNMGVDLRKVRAAVASIIGPRDSAAVHELGLTPRAKQVIELAVDEARRLNHRYIGTEHLLLGLLAEGQSVAVGVLESLRVCQPDVGRRVMQVIGQGGVFVGTGGMVMGPRTVPVPAPLGDLLRVIPIVQTQAVGDVRVTLLSLELYAHGFIIHDRATISDQTAPHPERMAQLGSLDFDISDDRGGHYHGRMQHGRTDGVAWYFGADYRPGIDPEAHELRVRVRGGGLPRPPEPAGGQQAAEPYPWLLTFSIPLHPEGR
ncbi:Clp protease N-terminal domain-containing protein [Nitrolancea hollandica]|uniref:Clp R domain-containing protein n=1 Tax=Nitrolancea hollandica Lb TaxID=1129897 RepID=I4EJ02_9BACT|nr:Clp protease N-terminal domain-containing protein [Nitrolancea hollandica]CCF84664.1 hypothetical protein NITHO_3720001 [Nitrolancea hollandica Lb]